MKKIMNAARKLCNTLDNVVLRVRGKLSDRRGAVDLITMLILIVIVAVICVTVFYPQLESLIKTLFSGTSDKVTALFDRT